MIFKVLVEHNYLPRDWVIPEQIHTPTTEGMLENLTGGGLTALESQMGGGL